MEASGYGLHASENVDNYLQTFSENNKQAFIVVSR